LSVALRVARNSFLNLSIDVITKASRALVFIIVARHLGPAEGGAFTVALSYQAVFQAFTLAGTDYLLVREVAKSRRVASEYFSHLVVMKVALGTLSWLVLLALLNTAFDYSASTNHIILLLALTILPEGLAEVSRALFVALEHLWFPTVVAFITGSGKLIASYLLLRQGGSLEGIALVVLAASILGAAVNLIYIFARLVRPTRTWRWGFFRSTFANLSAFAGMGVLRVVEYHVTILMLSYISNERQVGIYNAAYTLVLAVLMISQAYVSGAMPLFSRLHARSQQARLELLYRKSVRLLWSVALPLVILVIRLSPALVVAVYTFQYEETIGVLQVLSLVILLTLFLTPHTCIMLATNLQRRVVQVLVLSVATNVLAGLWLIPAYGAIGASAARVIATALVASLFYVSVRSRVVRTKLTQLVGLPTLAGVLMVVVTWMLWNLNAGLALLFGVMVYLVVVLLPFVYSAENRWRTRRALAMLVQELTGRRGESDGSRQGGER